MPPDLGLKRRSDLRVPVVTVRRCTHRRPDRNPRRAIQDLSSWRIAPNKQRGERTASSRLVSSLGPSLESSCRSHIHRRCDVSVIPHSSVSTGAAHAVSCAHHHLPGAIAGLTRSPCLPGSCFLPSICCRRHGTRPITQGRAHNRREAGGSMKQPPRMSVQNQSDITHGIRQHVINQCSSSMPVYEYRGLPSMEIRCSDDYA